MASGARSLAPTVKPLIPMHGTFVRDRWASEVEEFLELDYVPLSA